METIHCDCHATAIKNYPKRVRQNILAILLIFFCALLIAIRSPDILISPRFWFEEGSTYFAFACNNTLLDTLLFTSVGYYSFVVNMAVIAARSVPLEIAPLITTLIAFAVMMLPPALVIFGNSKYWDTPLKKSVISIGLILIYPKGIWLTSLCSIHVFSLVAFLILIEDISKEMIMKKWLLRILLLISGLTSPAASFFLPPFLYKAIVKERKRERIIQTIILLCCFLVQFAVLTATGAPHRFQRLNLSRFVATQICFFVLTPLSHAKASPDAFFVHIAFGIFFCALFFYIALKRIKNNENDVFVIGFIFNSLLVTISSLGMEPTGRYLYTSHSMLMILIVNELFNGLFVGSKGIRAIAICSIAAAFLFHGVCYRQGFNHTHWPKWKDEVVKYRMDKNYNIRIYPDWQWDLILNKQAP